MITQDNVPEKIIIKGTSDGLTITLGSGHWDTLLDLLDKELDQKAGFFKGGRALISVGNRLLNAIELKAMGDLVEKHHMTLWSVQSQAEETRQVANAMGLEVVETGPQIGAASKPKPQKVSPPVNQSATMTTKTIRHTLRSGQSIKHEGHVVVIGDVNPGAEIAAGGHIMVWGKLRGTVYAGAISPDDAFVCALELAPLQLAIGNVVSRAPSDGQSNQVIPEIAFVQDGQIVAEAWP